MQKSSLKLKNVFLSTRNTQQLPFVSKHSDDSRLHDFPLAQHTPKTKDRMYSLKKVQWK
jgi:hypothetical protein